MKNFITNPIKNQHWDPSKGDHVSDRILEEDKQYKNKQEKKKKFIFILAITHILLLFLIFLLY